MAVRVSVILAALAVAASVGASPVPTIAAKRNSGNLGATLKPVTDPLLSSGGVVDNLLGKGGVVDGLVAGDRVIDGIVKGGAPGVGPGFGDNSPFTNPGKRDVTGGNLGSTLTPITEPLLGSGGVVDNVLGQGGAVDGLLGGGGVVDSILKGGVPSTGGNVPIPNPGDDSPITNPGDDTPTTDPGDDTPVFNPGKRNVTGENLGSTLTPVTEPLLGSGGVVDNVLGQGGVVDGLLGGDGVVDGIIKGGIPNGGDGTPPVNPSPPGGEDPNQGPDDDQED